MPAHATRASSAIHIGILALSLHVGVVTPTINDEESDPERGFDYVPNDVRPLSSDIAGSNAFAFGGHDCQVVRDR